MNQRDDFFGPMREQIKQEQANNRPDRRILDQSEGKFRITGYHNHNDGSLTRKYKLNGYIVTGV